ncbi:MAG: hypothetical protein JO227_10300 [Acetobacteraceae bacterium]|nr:hypothetical protein [Acetobacteraceae bacterium]
MTTSELHGLLRDCLVLWGVRSRIQVQDDCLSITTSEGTFRVSAAGAELRPVRWFLHTPDRTAAGRPPRALPSIVALLSALRSAIGAEGGKVVRIGVGGPDP